MCFLFPLKLWANEESGWVWSLSAHVEQTPIILTTQRQSLVPPLTGWVSAACATFSIWCVQSSYDQMDQTWMSTFQNQLAWQSVLFERWECLGNCTDRWWWKKSSLACRAHPFSPSRTSSHASCSRWHPEPCWPVIACRQESWDPEADTVGSEKVINKD